MVVALDHRMARARLILPLSRGRTKHLKARHPERAFRVFGPANSPSSPRTRPMIIVMKPETPPETIEHLLGLRAPPGAARAAA